MMAHPKFLEQLQSFDTDTITDETCELMFPYLEMDDFEYEAARNASGDIAGKVTREIAGWSFAGCFAG